MWCVVGQAAGVGEAAANTLVLAGLDVRHGATLLSDGHVARNDTAIETERRAAPRTYESDADRAASYPAWLHLYDHHRPHTGIDGLTPAQPVHNVLGNYNTSSLMRCFNQWTLPVRHGLETHLHPPAERRLGRGWRSDWSFSATGR